MQTSLRGISNRAAKDKGHRFGNLYGLLDENFLKRCFWQLKKDAAPGVDLVDFHEYQADLDENIASLVKRLKQKKYRAKLVRRRYIPKINGKLRRGGRVTGRSTLITKKYISQIFRRQKNDHMKKLPPRGFCGTMNPRRRKKQKGGSQNVLYRN